MLVEVVCLESEEASELLLMMSDEDYLLHLEEY